MFIIRSNGKSNAFQLYFVLPSCFVIFPLLSIKNRHSIFRKDLEKYHQMIRRLFSNGYTDV